MLIGTIGWDWPDWTGTFYPENLPEDWRLSYYSVRLRAVLIPAEAWASAGEQIFATWCEDGDPEFRFVVECAGNARDRRRLERLAPRVLGVVLTVPTDGVPLPAEITEPAALWNADQDPAPGVIGPLLAARSSAAEPRAQRAVLEALAGLENRTTETCLFFDTPGKALQARTIADLMGV